MRVTENLKFNNSLNSLFSVENKYNRLLEQMSSQKRINRPSDDPVGTMRIMNIKQQQANIAQYRSNVDQANSWLSMTESKLTSVNDLLVKAKELALSQATATASASTRKISAEQVKELASEMLALANSKFGDRYLFSGTSTEQPFQEASTAATVGVAQEAAGNVFDGTVTSGGIYTADRNKTYAVKVTSGGSLADVHYVASSDGGKTWGAEQTAGLAGTVSLGDGVTLEFSEGVTPMAADDLFYAEGKTSGYYSGNGDNLTLTVGRSTRLEYSLSGEEVFADSGGGNADIFQMMNDLKTAMENDDIAGIESQIAKLDTARDRIQLCISQCGTKANRIEITQANMDELEERLTTMRSNTEDADMARLATEYAMKEVALQASYAMAAKIGQNTILDFLS